MATDELLALLDKQLNLYQKLNAMAVQQHALVSEEDPAALLVLLAERQRLLDELAELDAKIAPVRREWDRISPTLSVSARRRAKAAFQESRQLLEEIIASDQKDTELLEGRKINVQAALQTIGAAQQAHAAYGAQAPNLSRYFDCTDQNS
ncbi:MAG: flagellar export chaperone FlgN [Phycisphaerales bacterium]|nr:MAG: flagellar export chaperone FlgN [Phycisphaerales bacterium]